jgi:nucleoside-diphosphate-sugar epimerase
MQKILITGGAGYVGSVLVPYLIHKNYQITVLDLMFFGNHLNRHPNLDIVTGDIRDKVLINKIMPGHDIVIHLACVSNDPSFELNPKLGKSINLDAFTPLVESAKNNGVNRFIYASSSSVYGIKEESNVVEDMDLLPLTDYSKYKAECELILSKYSSNDFIVTTLRPATVCGYSPRQRLDVIVNILTNLAYNKRKITVHGGNQLRPNIHIKDMVTAYYAIINADKNKINGEIFNVGYENKTVIELAEIVKKTIGEDVSIVVENTDDNRSYHISSEKIKKVINFFPKYNIVDAVVDLKNAFKKKLLPDSLEKDEYFNLKRMQSIKIS